MSRHSPYHFSGPNKGNIARILSLLGIAFVMIGSGFYGPHWSFDYSSLSYEVRDTVLQYERVAMRALDHPSAIDIVEAQRNRQIWLMSCASTEELQALLCYPNAGIKLIAYKALLESHETDQYALIKRALSEDEAQDICISVSGSSAPGTNQYTTIGIYLLDYLTTQMSANNLTQDQLEDLSSHRNRVARY